MAEEIIQLDINELQPNPLQPRGSINSESLVDLVDSIKEHGILEPLVVAKTPAGFQIIAGERRWRAAQLAGLSEVPIIVKDTDEKLALELALIENIQRQDLSPLEEALAYEFLIKEYAFTQQSLADRLGKERATVANTLRILSLPPEIKTMISKKELSIGQAKLILSLELDSRHLAMKLLISKAVKALNAQICICPT